MLGLGSFKINLVVSNQTGHFAEKYNLALKFQHYLYMYMLGLGSFKINLVVSKQTGHFAEKYNLALKFQHYLYMIVAVISRLYQNKNGRFKLFKNDHLNIFKLPSPETF
jgi:hypothetical protein